MQAAQLHAPAVRVAFRADQLAVFATRELAAGEEILTVTGSAVTSASRFSIQIGCGEHLEPGDETGISPAATRFPWRFLNHSCAPNAGLFGVRLLARRPLARGDEVTFDYDTTEWHMAEPFACRCEAPNCRGRVAGYRHLKPAARHALAPWVAPHLLLLASRTVD